MASTSRLLSSIGSSEEGGEKGEKKSARKLSKQPREPPTTWQQVYRDVALAGWGATFRLAILRTSPMLVTAIAVAVAHHFGFAA